MNKPRLHQTKLRTIVVSASTLVLLSQYAQPNESMDALIRRLLLDARRTKQQLERAG